MDDQGLRGVKGKGKKMTEAGEEVADEVEGEEVVVPRQGRK